ncbi:MAG: hypothetical protein FJ276_02280 [Planctomycetes bacterium]|nr:hypothetical protein [Planctomycetota bacterium]
MPTTETYAAQWPRFRGPVGSGVSAWSDMPDRWDGTTGEGILWKVEVPLPGYNSPIVWEDRVFVSGATDSEQAVFCFDADSGALRWRRDIPPPVPGKEPLEVSEFTGYAAPTMATDGVRAYAVFASGDVVAVNFEGNQQWCQRLGPPVSAWGHASSLATYGSLLIVQFDQGKKADGRSRLMALDGATGRVVWEVAREVPASWASPIVVPRTTGDGHLLITSANPWVIAYAPENGREEWRARCLGGEIGPSPVMHAGVVYAANETGGMAAIRADGQGDVTETHIEWRTDINVPDVCSPLVTDEYVLLLKSGLLACFDRKGGDDPEPLWEEDLMEDVSSSPALVGDRVYIFSNAGPAWILQPKADQCERIRECEMGEPCRTSPAFQPGRIYIRGDHHLFCIGAGTAEEKPGQ